MQNDMRPEEFAAMIGVFVVATVFWVAYASIIAHFLSSPMKKIPEKYRQIAPGVAWLYLIPCVNIVVIWIFALMLPQSLRSHCDQLEVYPDDDCAKGIGLAWAICRTCAMVPYIGILPLIASIPLMIVFLVKTNQLASELQG